MRVLVTLTLPRQISCKLDAYKQKYYPVGFKKIASHITVIAPFDVKGDFGDLASELQTICRGIRPFEVKIDGVENFYDRIICYKLSCPEELPMLHNAVKKCVDAKFKRESARKMREYGEYKPHIAVALVTSRTAAKYAKMLEDERFSAIFLAKSLDLYAWRENRWHLRKTVAFCAK